jgi:outer membrane autotransporter protein
VLRDHLESRREQLKKPAKSAASAGVTGATPGSATAASESDEDDGDDAPAAKAAALTGVDFYFSGGGNILKNDSGASSPFFDFNSGFVSAGVDAPLGESFIVGASIAGHFGQARFHEGAGKIDQSQYRATAYVSAVPASWLILDASVSGGISRFESKRTIVGYNNSASTDAYDIGAALYASSPFNFFGDSLSLAPFVGIEYLHLSADAFTEESDFAPAAFRIGAIERESLQVRVGANLAWKVAPGGVPTRFILSASYGRELADTEADLAAGLVNSGLARNFNVKSVYTSEDTVQVGPSVEISSGRSSLSLGYRYETDFSDRTSHHIRGEFRVKF